MRTLTRRRRVRINHSYAHLRVSQCSRRRSRIPHAHDVRRRRPPVHFPFSFPSISCRDTFFLARRVPSPRGRVSPAPRSRFQSLRIRSREIPRRERDRCESEPRPYRHGSPGKFDRFRRARRHVSPARTRRESRVARSDWGLVGTSREFLQNGLMYKIIKFLLEKLRTARFVKQKNRTVHRPANKATGCQPPGDKFSTAY